MSELIQPRILKGFRDFLPADEIGRALLIEKLTSTFRSFGFVPIDTPALEYSEILLRKSEGETEKQVFRFTDNGGRDVALRFDLTVPFARFVAAHKEEIYFPFKRYHIAKVWRGEKPQAGRFREFVQCDFDIVGSDSAAVDFEILALMKTALGAIGVDGVTIKVSHRGIFNRFLQSRNLSEKSEEILRTVDKLSKIGPEETEKLLSNIAGEKNAADILVYIQGAGNQPEDFEATLQLMEKMAGGTAEDSNRLREIQKLLEAIGISKSFVLDPSITRGLDYYTGVVYETFLNDLPSIGSVCSGGRYDNLAGLYAKDKISGVGSSIGLDRLIAALDTLGTAPAQAGFTEAVIFNTDGFSMAVAQKTAADLRSRGVSCEVFPDSKKMGAQYAWAEKKAISWGITLTDGSFEVKNLSNRKTTVVSSASEVAAIIIAART
ncbi:MAG TPA: histidine--tRNA ligase [Treponema sp.]|nr:histidine--tRNA ligase [Treponema sp.]